ncbi:MAG: hypothetical protein MR411_07060 [Tenericutes bacterium]|nr:hypothetical protein [Mycoplasmatota bacterium]
MRELENYINDVERYIGNFESVISDIENSHYIDIMVEENNEKVKKSVSFYELKHYAHSSYVSNYFYEVQNDLSKAKQELDNLKNILRDLKNNNFAGINEITNNIINNNNKLIEEANNQKLVYDLRTLGDMDYNNKKSDKTYSKLLQEIKKESAILENEYHNTKLRNSDKVVNYVNNENTELNKDLNKIYSYDELMNEKTEHHSNANFNSKKEANNIISDINTIEKNIYDLLYKLSKGTNYVVYDIEKLADINDCYFERKLYDLKYINNFNMYLTKGYEKDIYNKINDVCNKANEKIDESDLSVSKELENNKTSKMLCMKNVLKSNYTDSKLMNINEANKFERKLNQMNINENSINRKNVLVNSKNLLNGLNSNLEYAKNAKENDSDEIQIKYVKNLVKNIDTYNNKEVLSKVEQEIMYINNLKQKQKYLEKLKNKLIKLEKKENSTSIFSKLFRR